MIKNVTIFFLFSLLANTVWAIEPCDTFVSSKTQLKDPFAYQKANEKSLKALFNKGKIVEKVDNPNVGTSGASFFISFKGSPIKGFMKEVNHDSGQSEVFAYEISRRLKLDVYPLTILRRINDQYYIVALKLEGFREITFAEWERFNSQHSKLGRQVFANTSYVRDMILDYIIGDSDHGSENSLYSPQTDRFASVDGAHALEITGSDSTFTLYGNLPFNQLIYLQDKEFFDELSSLNSTDVFKDLDRLFVDSDKAYQLEYARERFESLQRQIRTLATR